MRQTLSKELKQEVLVWKRGLNDPKFFYEEILGLTNLWDGLYQVVTAIQNNDRVTVKSGNGVGKDYISSFIALWFLCHFDPCIVITTAPTDRQIEKILWGEIRKKWTNSKKPLGGTLLTKELRISDDRFMIGFKTRETNETIGRLSGYHNPNQLVIVSEAQAIEPEIYEQIDGVLTGGNSKLLLIGNPLAPTGPFYDSFKDPNFTKITLSCLNHPNVLSGEDKIPGAVTKKWVESREQAWGKESPLYQSRVLGEFPENTINTIFSFRSVMSCIQNEEVNKNIAKPVRALGVDVARYGDDDSVFTICEGGKMIESKSVHGESTTSVAGRALQLARTWKAEVIVVDDIGVGGGVTDMLFEEAHKDGIEVLPFISSKRSSDRNKYVNRRAELMFRMADAFRNKDLSIPNDSELISELIAVHYSYNRTGQLVAEGKDDMRKRGIGSPDHADSLMLALYGSYFSQYGLDAGFESEEEAEERMDSDVLDEEMENFKHTGYPTMVKEEVAV